MSIPRRVSTLNVTDARSTSGLVVAVGMDAQFGFAPWSVRPLQLEGEAHLAALIGMIALALLSGLLVARNRYGGTASLTVDSETDHEDFLTDQERVCQLLQENGGRMKQATIVKETGWSNAKVSQLLSAMEDDDRIDKLRIGRENLISFPDEDVTDFDSE